MKEVVIQNPRSLQLLTIMACVLQENEHIRIVKFQFENAIVANGTGTIAVQLKNKQKLRENVLKFLNDKTISKKIKIRQ